MGHTLGAASAVDLLTPTALAAGTAPRLTRDRE